MNIIIGSVVKITIDILKHSRDRKFNNKVGIVMSINDYCCDVAFNQKHINCFFMDEVEVISINKYGNTVPIDNRYYTFCYWCKTLNKYTYVNEIIGYTRYCPKCLR